MNRGLLAGRRSLRRAAAPRAASPEPAQGIFQVRPPGVGEGGDGDEDEDGGTRRAGRTSYGLEQGDGR